MSSYYGVVFPEFWTGTTGRQLREFGKDAQLMGLYLATNRHANMLGLYRLRIDDIRHETGMGKLAIAKGLKAADVTDYARYDAVTEFAWVKQMARFRLGLKAGEGLREGDKRAAAVSRIYHAIESNPFLGEFHDANKKILTLGRRRESVGVVVVYSADHKICPLPGARVGASPDTESDTGIRKQDQIQEKAAAKTPRHSSPVENPRDNIGVVTRLAHEVIKADPAAGFADLKADLKAACSVHHIHYDADVAGGALESALAQRRAH